MNYSDPFGIHMHNEAEKVTNEPQKNSSDEKNSCVQELEKAQRQAAILEDQYKRLFAEFDNYRKRTERERTQWMVSAQSVVLLDLLTIVDDFERAFIAESEGQDRQGFELIYRALCKILERYSVVPIDQVTTFDPHLHEAILQVPGEGRQPGSIVSVLQKGYMCKGTVLRPAKVSVAQ